MRYRLRSLLIAMAVSPPVLAWVIWLAANSRDFWLCFAPALLVILLAALVSSPALNRPRTLGWVFARIYREPAWMAWWFAICLTGLFFSLLLAFEAIDGSSYTVATAFGVSAFMLVTAMAVVLRAILLRKE